jgi:hypothetical protein
LVLTPHRKKYACDVRLKKAQTWAEPSFPGDQFRSLMSLIRLVAGGVQLGPLSTAVTEWPIVPVLGDYEEGECGGMKLAVETEVLVERTPHQPSANSSTTNPFDTTRDRLWAPGLRSQRLTVFAMALPNATDIVRERYLRYTLSLSLYLSLGS